MKALIAILGISGVGKSTLVRGLNIFPSPLHLQASDIIKAEIRRRDGLYASSEELRLGPVISNQDLLVQGVLNACKDETRLVILDGHAVIFGEGGAIEIPPTVFRTIGCSAVVILEESPKIIRARRLRDVARVRPDLDESELSIQQEISSQSAARIAVELSIPVFRIRGGLELELRSIVQRFSEYE